MQIPCALNGSLAVQELRQLLQTLILTRSKILRGEMNHSKQHDIKKIQSKISWAPTSGCPPAASGSGWQCPALCPSAAAAASASPPPNSAGASTDPAPASAAPAKGRRNQGPWWVWGRQWLPWQGPAQHTHLSHCLQDLILVAVELLRQQGLFSLPHVQAPLEFQLLLGFSFLRGRRRRKMKDRNLLPQQEQILGKR